MAEDLLARAADLRRRGQAFALATVVRCEAPTSAKPGAKALILENGSVSGWVGGACAEPVVVREALAAFRDGRPRLIGLLGDAGRAPGRTAGMLEYPMTCHSGGTLEIYVEPYLPKRLLLLVGHGPVVDALTTLGRAMDYAIVELRDQAAWTTPDRPALTPHAAVVVATHADSDEDALERVLATDAGYVSLVASRRRAASIVERLRGRGVAAERLRALKAPAGLDIGAVTPEEIAVSILAEIIGHQRRQDVRAPEPAPAAAAEATDPVCGMPVEIATATYRSEGPAETVYFCCRGCKDTFDRRA